MSTQSKKTIPATRFTEDKSHLNETRKNLRSMIWSAIQSDVDFIPGETYEDFLDRLMNWRETLSEVDLLEANSDEKKQWRQKELRMLNERGTLPAVKRA